MLRVASGKKRGLKHGQIATLLFGLALAVLVCLCDGRSFGNWTVHT